MATVAYVAPELVTDGHADARTDVYSAGIVLFEMLTGTVPYDGDVPVDVAWKHVDNDVPHPSSLVKGLPRVLDDLVARATRRDPGARPTDAGALLAEVQVVRDDLGAANVETALLRQVPAVPARGGRRRDPIAPAVGPAGRLGPTARAGRTRRRRPGAATRSACAAGPAAADRRRILISAAIALMVLVVLGSTWWVTLGRYTDAPQW